MVSYVLTESLMKAIKEAADARPITIGVLLKLHQELNASSGQKSVPDKTSWLVERR